MANKKSNKKNDKKSNKKIATFKTLKVTTYTILPDLVGVNYFIFGRYTLATIRLTLIILAAIAVVGSALASGIIVVIILATAGLGDTDFTQYFQYALYALYAAAGIVGIDLIWTFVNIILVASGKFTDSKKVKIDKSYSGYATISRKERKLQKKNNKINKKKK